MNNGIIWVDGEVGAKAYQLQGQQGPIALWDTNDTVIYLKSVNQMGMPNPLQKIRYQMEDQPTGMLASGASGANMNPQTEANGLNDQKLQSEIDSLRNDIRELKDVVMQQQQMRQPNQNGSNNRQNDGGKGGNR